MLPPISVPYEITPQEREPLLRWYNSKLDHLCPAELRKEYYFLYDEFFEHLLIHIKIQINKHIEECDIHQYDSFNQKIKEVFDPWGINDNTESVQYRYTILDKQWSYHMNAWGKKLVHPDQFPEILKQKRKLKLYKIYEKINID